MPYLLYFTVIYPPVVRHIFVAIDAIDSAKTLDMGTSNVKLTEEGSKY
jgi:hypothetical protein